MKLDLKKIIREKNISSLVTNVVTALVGLLSFMLLTRQLTKGDFGVWVLYITLASFFDLMRSGLTQTSLVRALSAANGQMQQKLMASGFLINLYLSLFMGGLCLLSLGLFEWFNISIGEGYLVFLKWYPLLSLVGVGWNTAMSLFQARQQFALMMWVRLSNIGIFLIFLVLNQFYLQYSLTVIIQLHLVFNLFSSLWCTVKNWDGLLHLKVADRATMTEILDFGKYSMGTLMGSSLLKSADTLIIGLSPVLGSVGVAMYAIPLKLTDLIGIPLRSFSMTAYPKMSKMFIEGNVNEVRRIFYGYVGIVTMLFVPVAIGCFYLSEYLIVFLGGSAYEEVSSELAIVFKVFTVYTLLLPLDRFTGVLLDSINRPKLNLYKVCLMVVANILVDLVAVFWFESLIVVAIGTVVFTLLGLFLGLYFLHREIGVQAKEIVPQSVMLIKKIVFNG